MDAFASNCAVSSDPSHGHVPFPAASFPPGRRYMAYAAYLKQRFGGRLQKISIDAGFTCPNRDGSKGTGGCTFCANEAFVPGYCRESPDIPSQIEAGIRFHQRRYRRSIGYLAYFQAYSNTYADLSVLDQCYRQAVAHPSVRGFIVGTRPDCLGTDVLDLLSDWAGRTDVFVEIGIESCDDSVLRNVNRCHDFAACEDAVRACAARGLRVGAHLIYGLPGESVSNFINSATLLSTLPLHSIKIHQLQIFRGTPLAAQVQMNPDIVLRPDMATYLEHVTAFVERLRPDLWIERVGGEAPPQHVVGPVWGLRNDALLRAFEAHLLQHNTWQGRCY